MSVCSDCAQTWTRNEAIAVQCTRYSLLLYKLVSKRWLLGYCFSPRRRSSLRKYIASCAT